jgi:hypothetical protein
MSASVGPSVHEVFRSEGRISGEQGLLGGAQTPSLFQQPDGDSGPNDACFASAFVGTRINPGKAIAEVLNDPFQDLRLFTVRQFTQQFLEFAQTRHGRTVIVANCDSNLAYEIESVAGRYCTSGENRRRSPMSNVDIHFRMTLPGSHAAQRNAVLGSRRAARVAGSTLAMVATAITSPIPARLAQGSHGETP